MGVTKTQVYNYLTIKNMKNNFKSLLRSLLISCKVILVFSISSCKTNDEMSSFSVISIDQVIKNICLQNDLKSVKTVKYRVLGQSFENEQSGPSLPGPIHGCSYNYVYSAELNNRKINMSYDNIDFNYPFPYKTTQANLIINDQQGSISGQYNWSSFYLNQIEGKPLYSSRIEAILKNQKMANPIELLRDLSLSESSKIITNGNIFIIPSGIENLNIELTIDPETLLPLSARIKENDFLLGDVWFEIQYLEWINVKDIKYPSQLIFRLNGNIIKKEKISDIAFNVSFSPSLFEIESKSQVAYNKQQALDGIYSSQWYHRLFAGGIAIDQPLNNGALALEDFDISVFGLPNQKVGDKIKIFGRPDSSNWPVAIKTSTGIVMVEAPLNPSWTKSVLTAIHNKFPEEKISSIISTHTHYDHLSGIREAVAETKNVYVATAGIPYLNKVIKSEHKLLPDALSKNNEEIKINEVSNISYIANGEVEVHLLKKTDVYGNTFAIDNTHAFDMLIVYVPSEKTIIQADLLYCGVFLYIWNGKSPNHFSEAGKLDLKARATFLLDYIKEKKMVVSKVIGIHGGLASIDDLKHVAYDN